MRVPSIPKSRSLVARARCTKRSSIATPPLRQYAQDALFKGSLKDAAKRQKRDPPPQALLIEPQVPRDASQSLFQPLWRSRFGTHRAAGSVRPREALSDLMCVSTRRRSRFASASPINPSRRASEMAWRTKSVLPPERSRSVTVLLIVVTGIPSWTDTSSAVRSSRCTTTPFGFCRRSRADLGTV